MPTKKNREADLENIKTIRLQRTETGADPLGSRKEVQVLLLNLGSNQVPVRDLFAQSVTNIIPENAGKRPGLVISAGSWGIVFVIVREDRIPETQDQSPLYRDLEHQEPRQAGVLDRDSLRLLDRAEVDRLLRGRHRVDRPECML